MDEKKLYLVTVLANNKKDVCRLVENEYLSIDNINSYTPNEVTITKPSRRLLNKQWNYEGCKLDIFPAFYQNGWIYLGANCLEGNEEWDFWGDLTVNLESSFTCPVCNKIFVDTNNNPKLDKWLEKNNIALHTEVYRTSGFCSYPLMTLNYVLIYELNPERFEKAYFS